MTHLRLEHSRTSSATRISRSGLIPPAAFPQPTRSASTALSSAPLTSNAGAAVPRVSAATMWGRASASARRAAIFRGTQRCGATFQPLGSFPPYSANISSFHASGSTNTECAPLSP